MLLIKQIFNEYNKRVGYVVSQNNEELVIPNECVFSREILDDLLTDGIFIEDVSNKTFRISETQTSDDLPIVSTESCNYNDDLLMRSLSIYSDILSPSEVMKEYVKVIQSFTVATEESINLIKTREEFLEFLEKEFKEEDTEAYLPINYMVSKEALFTIQEYKSEEFIKYRRLIENRLHVTIKQHRLLCEFFISLGKLKTDFDWLEFLEVYYSWGIPGINEPITGIKKDSIAGEIDHATGKTIHYTSGVLALWNNKTWSRNFYYGFDGTKWVKELFSDADMKKQAYKKATFLAGDSVCVAMLTKNENIPFIKLSGDNFYYRMSYNYSKRVGMDTIGSFLLPNYTISHLFTGEKYELNKEEFNLSKIDLFEDSKVLAVVNEFLESTKKHTNASSYDILCSLGFSPVSAILKIAKDVDALSELKEDIEAATSNRLDIYQVEQMLRDYIYAAPTRFDNRITYLFEQLVDSIRDGEISIDSLGQGIIDDNLVGVSVISNNIKAISGAMGEPLQKILKTMIEKTEDGEKNIVFMGNIEDNFIELKMNLPTRDNAFLGAKKDKVDYRNRAAKESRYLWFIKGVLKEAQMEGVKPIYDVGVIVSEFDKDATISKEKGSPRIIDVVSVAVRNAYEQYSDPAQLDTFNKYFDYFLSVATMSLAMTGQAKVRGTDHTFTVDNSILVALKSNIVTKIDSLLAAHHMISVDGENVYTFCVNAQILPDRVVPNKGESLAYYPFMQYFVDNRGLRKNNNPGLISWIRDGVIPQDFIGFEANYLWRDASEEKIRYAMLSYDKPEKDMKSLIFYKQNLLEQQKNAAPGTRLLNMSELRYPNITNNHNDEEEISETTEVSAGLSKKFGYFVPYVRTYDEYIKEYPEVLDMLEIEIKEESEYKTLKKFKGFTLSMLDYMGKERFYNEVVYNLKEGKIAPAILNGHLHVYNGSELVKADIYNIKSASQYHYIVEVLPNEFLIEIHNRLYLFRPNILEV